LSMNMYTYEPPTTSGCIALVIPETLNPGTPLEISGSAVSGAINALAVDITDGTAMLHLTDCNLPELNISADLDLPYGSYDLTAVDWTDDTDCSLLVEQTITIQDPITQINVSMLPPIAVSNETEIELVLWVVGGTDVVLMVDRGGTRAGSGGTDVVLMIDWGGNNMKW